MFHIGDVVYNISMINSGVDGKGTIVPPPNTSPVTDHVWVQYKDVRKPILTPLNELMSFL